MSILVRKSILVNFLIIFKMSFQKVNKDEPGVVLCSPLSPFVFLEAVKLMITGDGAFGMGLGSRSFA